MPLGGLGIVDIECRALFDFASSATQHDHKLAHRVATVLESGHWRVLALVRGLDPGPPSISVPPQPPSIIQERLLAAPSPKHYHHSRSRA